MAPPTDEGSTDAQPGAAQDRVAGLCEVAVDIGDAELQLFCSDQTCLLAVLFMKEGSHRQPKMATGVAVRGPVRLSPPATPGPRPARPGRLPSLTLTPAERDQGAARPHFGKRNAGSRTRIMACRARSRRVG